MSEEDTLVRASGDITIRPARADDFAAIGRLTVAAYRADGQLANDNPYESELADAAGRADAGELLVAELAGNVVGSVLVVLPGSPFAELAAPGEAEFRMLAVDPAAQGNGVGLALARACLDHAVELECSAVVIFTRDFATTAHRMYVKLGFVRTPERDWSPWDGVTLLAMRWNRPRAGEAPDADRWA